MASQAPQPKEFHHPFEPYDIQQQFMENVYDCIESKQVGVFESPTGTGKSLSLICGSLTWLREHKRKMYDEAIATSELDADEPEWILDHAKDVRRSEIRQMREELETRLASVRAREKRIRDRISKEEPAFKRQKQSQNHGSSLGGEEQFVLDDYNTDDEVSTPQQSAYSIETTKLMQAMGIIPKKEEEQFASLANETKVFFCSRTHSQLTQFIGELQRVKLPPGLAPSNGEKETIEELRHLTLGSRKNLCINSQVKKLSDQTAINERCIELQKASGGSDKKCSFLPSKDKEDVVFDFRDHALATISDIEDLANLGSRLQVCPYYASRSAIGSAEIVTLPYPLLLQRSAREALDISLKGHIVIIDEAHNLMHAVEGIYSSAISELQLKRAKEGLIVYLQKFRNRLKGSNRSYVTQVVRVIESLLQFVSRVTAQASHGDVTSPEALLAGKGVDQINLARLVRYINESKLARKVEGYISYLSEANRASKKDSATQAEIGAQVPVLTCVQNFLLTLMNPSREGRFTWSQADQGVTIKYLLLDPSQHFRDVVDDARAVILAGGTMSPMDDYRQQLFPYLKNIKTFSCGHLIPPSSLFVRSATRDDVGRIDFSFKGRNEASSNRLGGALLDVCQEVQGGMVVFLPSYGYLESIIRAWEATSTMTLLKAKKAVFFDSRQTSAEDTFRAYSEATSSDNRGALLFSVIGGKLSEGINFADDLGRCVVVVGLPFPNLESPEWKIKMRYLDDQATARGLVKGKASREHAENVCMRSVNQAIGRAIRHKNDWASIILFDARYADDRIQAKLPGWIKSSSDVKASGLVRDVVGDLRSFFIEKTESHAIA